MNIYKLILTKFYYLKEKIFSAFTFLTISKITIYVLNLKCATFNLKQ